ncbi:Mating-type switching protein swi10 [Cytospora mali]|uniref:Mating-type switching protein swi10 n=1 Tax=Cytospora mali TaxID=578113 RepID=A0A194UP59_CYTMA|nr:Mating-type switching protein swi10 [Valsa mali var. pyri (nom. inval.)]
MDDDFGADQDFLAALAASEAVAARSSNNAAAGPSRPRPAAPGPSRVQQPTPQKIQQPTPQRLDRAPPAAANNNTGPGGGGGGVKQPTPQALPQRSAGSSILVSPRQKGNPVLACIKSLPWEYSDIPADYGLGLTTCALFLSLKYHRLHPEYIYTRIRNLQGRYNLRVLLAMVDIPNHEDSLRELSKTSLVNNVTLILCWSAAEAARYLELYKSYEHASFAAIKGAQASTYAERLVEFVTVPRAVNKADAVALVSTFGSLRQAVNADPETVAVVGGWGEKKVKAWCAAVEEPFRVKKAGKRGLEADDGATDDGQGSGRGRGRGRRNLDEAVPIGLVPLRDMAGVAASRSQGERSARASGTGGDGEQQQAKRARQFQVAGEDDDDEEAELAAAIEESKRMAEEEARSRALGTTTILTAGEASSSSKRQEELADGVAAALKKLRKG